MGVKKKGLKKDEIDPKKKEEEIEKIIQPRESEGEEEEKER